MLKSKKTSEPSGQGGSDGEDVLTLPMRREWLNQPAVRELSLGLFSYYNPIRSGLRRILEDPWFDRVILILIMANCVTMAASAPTGAKIAIRDHETWTWEDYMEQMDAIFVLIFVVEACIKIIVLGFIRTEKAYLKSPWNVLDFVILVTSVLTVLSPFLPDTESGWIDAANFSPFRAFRVLRPLRVISSVAPLRIIISAFLLSLPSMLDAVALLMFVLMSFAIVSVALWKGKLWGRCAALQTDEWAAMQHLQITQGECRYTPMLLSTSLFEVDPNLMDRPCSQLGNDLTTLKCPWDYPLCHCSKDYTRFDTETYGLVSFDNVAKATLVLLVSITQEGWSDVMYQVFSCCGQIWAPYWVALIVLGSFFVSNLIIIIINEAFMKCRDEEKALAHIRKAGKVDFGAKAKKNSWNSRYKVLITKVPSGVRYIPWLIVSTNTFQTLIILAVVANTVILCFDHAGQSKELELFLDTSNVVFNFIFLGEMALKITAWTLPVYIRSTWNLFDASLVLISMSDVLYTFASGASGSGNTYVSVSRSIRVVRVLRILRLVNFFANLRRIVESVLHSMKEIILLTVLLMLVIFIYAALGMDVFAYKLRPPFLDHTPRTHFDTFFNSSLTVFQVMTGENWNTVMYTTMEATMPVSCIFFISLYFLSNYVVLNMFIAVLVAAFHDEEGDVHDEIIEKRGNQVMGIARLYPTNEYFVDSLVVKDKRRLSNDLRSLSSLSFKRVARSFGLDDEREVQQDLQARVRGFVSSKGFQTVIIILICASSSLLAWESPLDPPDVLTTRICNNCNIVLTLIFTIEMFLKMYALGLLSNPEYTKWKEREKARADAMGATDPDSILDVFQNSNVEDDIDDEYDDDDEFEFDDDDDDDDDDDKVQKDKRRGDPIAFTPYLREPFNVLDGVIVIISLLSILPWFNRLGIFKVLRALRPLRFVSNSQGMRSVTRAVLLSLSSLLYVLLLGMIIWLMFGIMGVQVFKERYGRCIDGTQTMIDATQLPFILTKSICQASNWSNSDSISIEEESGTRVFDWNATVINGTFRLTTAAGSQFLNRTWHKIRWTLPFDHFDNIGSSVLTLFEVATLEGWVDVMWNAVDMEGPDEQPIEKTMTGTVLFFFSFIIIGSFLLLNLFVSVLLSNYYRVLQEQGSILKSRSQQEWIQALKIISTYRPESERFRGRKGFKKVVAKMVTTRWFEMLCSMFILINALIMALEHYPQSEEFLLFLTVANCTFTGLYLFEVLLKLYGLGYKLYLKDMWNRFDIVICTVSIIGMIVDFVDISSSGAGISTLRLMRFTRMLKMLQIHEGLNRLVNTLIDAIPELINVSGLVFLIFFIYAVIGCQEFVAVERGEFINGYANFEGFLNSFLLLFRMSTGENWQGIMADVARPPCGDPDYPCGPSDSCNPRLGQCVSPALAKLYFLSFVAVVDFICINLFIAVMVESFENMSEKAASKISAESIAKFVTCWQQYDLQGIGQIKSSQINQFFYSLDRPLGLRPQDNIENFAFLEHAILLKDCYNPYNKLRLIRALHDLDPPEYTLTFQTVLVALSEDILTGHMPFVLRVKILRAVKRLLRRFKRRRKFIYKKMTLIDNKL